MAVQLGWLLVNKKEPKMVALTINVLGSKMESTRVLMKVALTPHLLGPMMESETLMVPLSNLWLGSTMAGETSMVELTNLATY